MTPCSLTQGYQLSEEADVSILKTEGTSEVVQNVTNHLKKLHNLNSKVHNFFHYMACIQTFSRNTVFGDL
jgi:hypothetical protein